MYILLIRILERKTAVGAIDRELIFKGFGVHYDKKNRHLDYFFDFHPHGIA